ncbi:MAG: NUDIX hydrolase [Armatimonadetes bacterium]|nr:NUDIX hydrolase [Armatimonadota bacterium]
MKRRHVLWSLEAYAARWARGRVSQVAGAFDAGLEAAVVQRVSEFVRRTPDCLERTWSEGHLTGSAMVANRDLTRVLLTHHRKLDMWIQLGGHADGHPLLHEVSLREAQEESGNAAIDFVRGTPLLEENDPVPFDVDVHRIPARKNEPAHYHYDVRYLLVADEGAPVVVSDESHDLRWLALDEARGLTTERSMHRMFDKLDLLRALLD